MDNNKIIDGKMVSELIKTEISRQVVQLEKQNLRRPVLNIIQVGDNKASNTYIKNKQLACEKVGILCNIINCDEKITENELITIINNLNNDPKIDGILVQLPLPKQINDTKIINTISLTKDVDGFTPEVLGNLMLGHSHVLPATPKGIMALFKYYKINLSGQHVVIIGRSNIVGKPLANLLINASATVTICHSKTNDLKSFTTQADILISAVGIPKFITADMVKENAIIIDVGINCDENNKLCGDIDFDNVFDKVKMITPVPGGVGPMTIASLLENILYLYQQKKES